MFRGLQDVSSICQNELGKKVSIFVYVVKELIIIYVWDCF